MSKISLPVKYGYTLFAIVLAVYYWREYGPTNFLYFCDVALFLVVAAVWTEKSIYASLAAVGISLPQLFWQLDFMSSLVGFPVVGMTAYMFDEQISLFARGLSFFHFWLPMLVWFLVWRLGYDRRALVGWTVIAWGLMLVSYFLLPAPGDPLAFPNQPHNVNYVYGLSDSAPQAWMPASAWLSMLLVGLPLLFYFPTHLLLSWLDSKRPVVIGMEI
ncbi:hypothetical protein FF011L_09320 [Roseimaritima multifibrata]|uniref:Membrane-associated protein n=1 Tax=Roseimaritima multifibrata TaxID=1930274 RepID=A0A517MBE3_9BACT|nr:hypothetical protein [Roseimaritima multifibrata]QDS92195.1 hypothetical protein FF011L_09320 [Roseimaritima multifibrata]